MSEPAAPYAATPSDPAPTCAPADRPQTRQAGRRCFDHACPVAEGCPLYQRRHGPLCGPMACSWRYGWEYRDGLCAVALAEAERGNGQPDQPDSGAPPEVGDA